MTRTEKRFPLPGRIVLAALLLLLPSAGLLSAQEDVFRDTRTKTVGLRLGGGVSWSLGSSFENQSANPINLVQPYFGGGLVYNFSPLWRMGLDYSYTHMQRSQHYSALQGEDGAAYRDFDADFHGPALSAELNLVELFAKGKGQGRFSLYAGAGAGYLFSNSNTYTFSIATETTPAVTTFGIRGHNAEENLSGIYIPLTLSLEYAVLPEVAVTLGGEYRFLPGEKGLRPSGQAIAKAGLVFNLTGKGRKKAVPATPVIPLPLKADTVYVEKVVEVPIEKIVEVPVRVQTTLPYVSFERGSSKLDETANCAALDNLLATLKGDPSLQVDIIGWTDHTGGDAINESLSASRAEALRDYLTANGIDASRIVTVEGRGKSPLSGEDALSAKARRAEAIIRDNQ